jgi:hypothetical protein
MMCFLAVLADIGGAASLTFCGPLIEIGKVAFGFTMSPVRQ